MSLNGRLKARAASFARTAYPPILGFLRRVLSERQLQGFILVCDRLKAWLLRGQSSYRHPLRWRYRHG